MSVHIMVTTSSNYDNVFRYFLQSLCGKPGIHLHVDYIDLSAYIPVTFQSEGWYYACRERIVRQIRFLEKHPEVDYAIMSDADIQYFRPEKLAKLVNSARMQKLDYYGMRENDSEMFNGGFYIIRNSVEVRQLLQNIVDTLGREKPELADQTILNRILFSGESKLTYDFIPSQLYLWGDGYPGPNAIFHHAVWTMDTRSKVKQLAQVRERYFKMIGYPAKSILHTKAR